MNNKTKRICLFPGCTIRIPNYKGTKNPVYCQGHSQNRNGWTHQTAWGVLPLTYLQELQAEAV